MRKSDVRQKSGLDELKELCHLARKQRPKKPRYPDRVKELISDQYSNGMSIPELMRATKLSDGFIRKSLSQVGESSNASTVKVVEVVSTHSKDFDREVILSLETQSYRVSIFAPGAVR